MKSKRWFGVGVLTVIAAAVLLIAPLIAHSQGYLRDMIEDLSDQPIAEIDEQTLSAAPEQPRAIWIKWENGDIDFLGVDVNHDVIGWSLLREAEWKAWCLPTALPDTAPHRRSYAMPHDHPIDTIFIYPVDWDRQSKLDLSPTNGPRHCEFRYTDYGWTMGMVDPIPRTAGELQPQIKGATLQFLISRLHTTDRCN